MRDVAIETISPFHNQVHLKRLADLKNKRIHLSLLFSSTRWFWLNFDYEMLIAESTNLHSNNTEAG